MNKDFRWIAVTHTNNIPLREARAVEVEGKELAIFNLGERFLAMENRCPHRGGPLADGIVSGNVVVCPLHGWKVCLEDGSVVKPAGEGACLASYRTCVQDGVLSVEIPARTPSGTESQVSGNHSSPAPGEASNCPELESGPIAG